MQIELGLAAEQQKKHELPVREKPDGIALEEIISRRRMLRVEINDFAGTLAGGDLVDFAIRIGRIAFVTAGTCAQFGVKPDFEDYAAAVSGMITDAQREMDKALQLSDWPAVVVAGCKLHQIWIGCAANLGLPYGSIIHYLHDCYMKNADVQRHAVAQILRNAGLTVEDIPANAPPGAANDAPATSDGTLCAICQGNIPCGTPGHPGSS